jgi:hypothetical protein
MEAYKIDILKTNNVLIAQNMVSQEQKYFTISELEGNLLDTYSIFDLLVDNKITTNYTQIYVSIEPVRRFVVMTVSGTTVSGIEEVLYENLSEEERTTFDNFYNLFIN